MNIQHHVRFASKPATAGNALRLMTLLFLFGTVRLASAQEPAAKASPTDATPVVDTEEPNDPTPGEGVGVLCVDSDGKPVAGAEVYLFQNVAGEPSRYKQFGPYTSDEQGRAKCPRAVVQDGRGHFDRWAYARVPGRLVGIIGRRPGQGRDYRLPRAKPKTSPFGCRRGSQ